MSQYNLETQGENVHISFVSTATTTIAAVMNLFNANWVARVLQPYERLVIDDLEGQTNSGIVSITQGSTGVVNSTLIASFNSSDGLALDPKEGIPLPIGVLPFVNPEGAASTATIRVSGNGRIVEGSTQGVQPNWQATLNTNGLR